MKTERPRAFFYHYNRTATARRGKPTLTVHWQGACHLVDNIVLQVPTAGRIRKTQPRVVIAGKARSMTVKNGVAILT